MENENEFVDPKFLQCEFKIKFCLHVMHCIYGYFVMLDLVDVGWWFTIKWDQPDSNRRPPAPEAGIIPS